MNLISICLFWINALHSVLAHSWVECTSYDPPSFDYQTLGNYDRARCSGYPRAFKNQYNVGFGVDRGYNWGHPDCSRDPFNPNDYNDVIKMANFKPGQTIYISHPAKNHVADICTNRFIPSTSMNVRMSSQPNVDTFDIYLPMLGEDHKNEVIDHLGYQRCFNFCGDQDKSHCITAWTLPNNIPEGRYSFIWIWQFNKGEYYSNCFDAFISQNESPYTIVPMPNSSSSGSRHNDTITFPPTTSPYSLPPTTSPIPTPVKSTPYPLPSDMTTMPLDPTPSPSEMTTMPSTTESPSTKSVPPIITSGVPTLPNPLLDFGSYILNLTGNINISGLLNISWHADR